MFPFCSNWSEISIVGNRIVSFTLRDQHVSFGDLQNKNKVNKRPLNYFSFSPFVCRQSLFQKVFLLQENS